MMQVPHVRSESDGIVVEKLIVQERWLLPNRWKLVWRSLGDPAQSGVLELSQDKSLSTLTATKPGGGGLPSETSVMPDVNTSAEGNSSELRFSVTWIADRRRSVRRRRSDAPLTQFVTPSSVMGLTDTTRPL